MLAIDPFAYLVNMKMVKKLSLYPPVEFLQFVEKVEQRYALPGSHRDTLKYATYGGVH